MNPSPIAPEPQSVPLAQIALGEAEIEAVAAVLRSGQLRQGKLCAEFERRFAETVGARQAVAVSSGTAALHLACLALIEPGDEVIVPAFTFIATASAVVLAGGRPVFCDAHPETATLDPRDAAKRITSRTRAIAPVHLYGNACDVSAIQGLARQNGLKVVWDAAQAHGTTFAGKDIGGLDDLVCYSFYPTKNMTTGEGGMITCNDGALAERLRLLRSHGQAQKYYHTLIGLNYRMTDIQAAIGLAQLERLPKFLRRRRENARLLDALLAGVPGVKTLAVSPAVEHSYHQYTITIDPAVIGRSRDEVQAALGRMGVETAVHYPRPLHQQPVFAAMFPGLRLPVSEQFAASVLSLPVHPALAEAQLRWVGQVVREVCTPA